MRKSLTYQWNNIGENSNGSMGFRNTRGANFARPCMVGDVRCDIHAKHRSLGMVSLGALVGPDRLNDAARRSYEVGNLI